MSVAVPCGKCPECLKRRVSGWSFRLRQEEKVSSSAFFITLTYDTEHVPITKNGFMSLNKKHVQDWMKRLRKHVSINYPPQQPIKYYVAGEYGGKTNRPHYHAIIFNVPNEYDIEKTWKLGQCHYGKVEAASVGYTLKYMDKPKRIPMHVNDDRIREFGLMSKGLGSSYLTQSIINYHHADLINRFHLTIEDGKKIAMPRYYKQKIYTDQERKRIAFFLLRDMIKRQEKVEISYPGGYNSYVRDKVQSDLGKFRRFNSPSQQKDKT